MFESIKINKLYKKAISEELKDLYGSRIDTIFSNESEKFDVFSQLYNLISDKSFVSSAFEDYIRLRISGYSKMGAMSYASNGLNYSNSIKLWRTYFFKYECNPDVVTNINNDLSLFAAETVRDYHISPEFEDEAKKEIINFIKTDLQDLCTGKLAKDFIKRNNNYFNEEDFLIEYCSEMLSKYQK